MQHSTYMLCLQVMTNFSVVRNVNTLFIARWCSYVGNVHSQVTEPLLQEVFSSTGPLESCKLIRKEKVISHPPLFLMSNVSICYLNQLIFDSYYDFTLIIIGLLPWSVLCHQ